jgi:hypothetical protein
MTQIGEYNAAQQANGSPYPVLTCNVVPKKASAVPAIVPSPKSYQQSDEPKYKSNSSSSSKKEQSKEGLESIKLPLLGDKRRDSSDDLDNEYKRPASRGYGTL